MGEVTMHLAPLNEYERWLVDMNGVGRKADFVMRFPDLESLPTLSAELIRRLVIGQAVIDGQSSVYLPCGLQVRGAEIRGRLDLADISGDHGDGTCVPLVFESCRFIADKECAESNRRSDPTVDLRHARCSRVAFIDCELTTLVMDDALIAGDLDLRGLRSVGGDGVQCSVQGRGMEVQGSLNLSGAKLSNDFNEGRTGDQSAHRQAACDFKGTTVQGSLTATDGLSVLGGVNLPRRVRGNVDFSGATLRCATGSRAGGVAVNGSHCEVDGAMIFRPQQRARDVLPFICYGTFYLYGMKVGGSIDFSGGQIFAPGGQGASPAIDGFMLHVGGSVFIRQWEPEPDGSTSKGNWPAKVYGSSIYLNAATIEKRMHVVLANNRDTAELELAGLTVKNITIEQLSTECNMRSVRVDGDVYVNSFKPYRPSIRLNNASIGGFFWLEGQFDELDASCCSITGDFEGKYEATRITAEGCHISGTARFRIGQALSLPGAELKGSAIVVSVSKAPGVQVLAKNVSVGLDLTCIGKIKELALGVAAIGGMLRLDTCTVNTADLDGIRVRGDVTLPKSIFGKVHLKGARIEGSLHLKGIRLHFRKRPSGQTRPRIDLQNAHVHNDLIVDQVTRDPLNETYQEVDENPAWLQAIEPSTWSQKGAHLLRRVPTFYKGAEIVELHLPYTNVEATKFTRSIECHSFLLFEDGRAIYLNGESSPIHEINMAGPDSPTLVLEHPNQAMDYLRFFCGYVWSKQGAFIIKNGLDESERKIVGANDDLVAKASALASVSQDGDTWICEAVIRYGDDLFCATFRITPDGRVQMENDVELVRVDTQGVAYPRPHRTYQLRLKDLQAVTSASHRSTSTAPNDTGGLQTALDKPHAVILDNDWHEVNDIDDRMRIVERIRATLTQTSLQPATLIGTPFALIDLQGFRCRALDDDNGAGWGDNVGVDVRGFVYEALADGVSGATKDANAAFTDVNTETSGEELAILRCNWLERVTKWRAFSGTHYEQLVTLLATRGDPDASRRVLEHRLKRENENRRQAVMKWGIRLCLEWPFRYGLFSRRGLMSVCLYWLLGIVLFDVANYGALRLPPIGGSDSPMVMTTVPLPIKPVLVVDSTPVTSAVMNASSGQTLVTAQVPESEYMTAEISCRDIVEPSLYALDLMLPLIDLRQESKCIITSSEGLGPLAWRFFRAIYAIVGAYMTAMLVLTLSGVLRRSTER